MYNPSICVTGGFGFIGSNFVAHLNSLGITPLVIENLSNAGEKWRNVIGLSFTLIARDEIPWGATVVHLAANVDTTEAFNGSLWDNNINYSLALHRETVSRGGRFIYASSAATYGAEESDFRERIDGLKPLNAYGFTKWQLDNALKDKQAIGLRFFNVFGPREGHKGRMASVVHNALTLKSPLYTPAVEMSSRSIRTKSDLAHWSLFKSHREGVSNGDQCRDFIYCQDVCKIIHRAIFKEVPSGIYNVGTGVARTFNDLVKAVDPTLSVRYVDMPSDLHNQYQYRTCADISRLRTVLGYTAPFTTLEEGIAKTRAFLADNPL